MCSAQRVAHSTACAITSISSAEAARCCAAFSAPDAEKESRTDSGGCLPGDAVTASFQVLIPELYPGSFSFSPFVSDGSLVNPAFCDFVENAVTIPMARGERIVYGYLHVPCRVEQPPTPQHAEERSIA